MVTETVENIDDLDEFFDYDTILQRMLDRVSSQIDKREGSIIYDALAPAAAELAQMYIVLKYNVDLVFADTATDEYLDRLADQVGIIRSKATNSIRKAQFYDAEENLMDISIGSRFSIGELVFKATEKITTGTYKMECETAGKVGNSVTGTMIPVDYIENLVKAILTDILIPGEDTETDDSLRARMLEQTAEKAFAGNIVDYKNKTKEIDGVGEVKVTPIWNGPGTVKLTILDSDYNKASELLINNVQNEICPDFSAEGIGLAPIGHVVTVDTVTEKEITVSASVITNGDISESSLKEKIKIAVNGYLLKLRQEWEDTTALIVRKAQIESLILSVDDVIDVSNVTLNGETSNILLDEFEIPILKEVVIL